MARTNILADAAKQNGFKDLADRNRHIQALDLSSPEKLEAFRKWSTEDRTKAGILKLPRKQRKHVRGQP
jgi:hypothetical protein